MLSLYWDTERTKSFSLENPLANYFRSISLHVKVTVLGALINMFRDERDASICPLISTKMVHPSTHPRTHPPTHIRSASRAHPLPLALTCLWQNAHRFQMDLVLET